MEKMQSLNRNFRTSKIDVRTHSNGEMILRFRQEIGLIFFKFYTFTIQIFEYSNINFDLIFF